jgi:hypothetical protein
LGAAQVPAPSAGRPRAAAGRAAPAAA